MQKTNNMVKEVTEVEKVIKRPDMIGNKFAVGARGNTSRRLYEPSLVNKVEEYMEKCEDVRERIVKSESSTGQSYEIVTNVNLPTQTGLARMLGVDKSTITLWAKKYPEFGEKIERLQQLQHDRLINGGLSGTYNYAIAKMLLTKHGYYDEERVQHTGPDGGPIEILIEERKKKIYDIARMYDVEIIDEKNDQEGSDTTAG